LLPHRSRIESPTRHASRLAALRAELDAWMKQQDNAQTLFGLPLLRGEPVTIVVPAVAPKKKSP
jgi:hypothetical protein